MCQPLTQHAPSYVPAVKGVLIGKVPDRGGRPEGRKREADMPEWKARQVRLLAASCLGGRKLPVFEHGGSREHLKRGEHG